MKTLKIALSGPESTGKTELSGQLAEYFGGLWVEEYAREYIASLNRDYTLGDIEIIARQQLGNEKMMYCKAGKVLFCDTELTVCRIWAEHAFGHCPQWITDEIARHTYDLVILCFPDIPWVYDPLREHPHLREYLFSLYEGAFRKQNYNYRVLKGLGANRLKNAVEIIKEEFPHL